LALFYCAVVAIGSLRHGYDNTYYNGVLAMQTFKNDYGGGSKALIIIGSIVTQSTLKTSYQYVIVVFTYIAIVGFNLGAGPLAYTIAREVSVGPNQNKIMSAAIVSFYFWTWCITFIGPYLYYNANLGPMLGFIYAGGCCIALAYTWF
jgi:hypothetical protein